MNKGRSQLSNFEQVHVVEGTPSPGTDSQTGKSYLVRVSLFLY